jgi:hypothetical protein
MHRPIQTAVQFTGDTVYKTLDPVEQNDLEFLIPGDSDTYIDLHIKLNVRGKMFSSSGKDVDLTDTTAVANNLLHFLFIQCIVILNVVPVTQSPEHYNYRAYLETLLTYGTDAASSMFLTLIGTSIQATCSLAILKPKRTHPPQTTDL